MKKIIIGCIISIITLLSITPALAGGRFNDAVLESVESIQPNIETSFQSQQGMEGAS